MNKIIFLYCVKKLYLHNRKSSIMKKNLLFIIILLFQTFLGISQTQFWSDTFEDLGAPTSGVRNASTAFTNTAPSNRHFSRLSNIDILNVSAPYSGLEGTKFWAGEDTDNGVTPITLANVLKTVTWTGINISGKSGLSLRGLFAVGNLNQNVFDNGSQSSTGVFDHMSIQYSIDGGPIQNLLSFYPLANANSALYPDTNFDGNGDPSSAALTTTFTEFTANIQGTGSTLTLYMNMAMTGVSEEVAIDNLRLFETPACSNPTITMQPANASVCNNGNTTFSINATGATAYQWQVNCGSGFSNVTNGGVYSGATTSTLTLTGATTLFNGCLYRCITSQSTCNTTSNSATLTVSIPSLLALSQTNVSCFGGNTGAASVNPAGGGISPYTYNWTPGNPSGDGTTSVTGLTAGTWTCTVTDAVGCFATRTFNITQPTALSVTVLSQTNVACNGGSSGAVSINVPTGGAGGYTYNWTPGNPTGDGTRSVSGLTAGNWTCTVTDANGCSTFQAFNIVQPQAIVLNANTQTNVSCFGGNNGAAAVVPATGGSGGFTYNWTPGNPTGDGTVSVTGLTAGTWACTVTDANNCTTQRTFNITQPVPINNAVTQNLGVLTATQSGATYQWYICPNTNIPTATSQSFTPTVVGDYKVDVTIGGCTVTSNCITLTTLTSQEFSLNNTINVYPNPSKGLLNINSIEDFKLNIYNNLGQFIKTISGKANTNNNYNVSDLPNGIYFLKVNIKNIDFTQKIIIQN